MDDSGAALARAYFAECVRPLVVARWPGLPFAAGRLGSGSDVLGYDDVTSRDHDWGLRLTLLVPVELAPTVDRHLEEELPEAFGGYPVRFATSWDPAVRHRVQVDDVASLVGDRTGLDLQAEWSLGDWLSLTGQAVLEITGGPVFADTAHELTDARRRLEWYPDDLWTYVVATDWARIGQELPFVSRTALRGDALGSRVITARLTDIAIHLAHLLQRRWQPYAKWAGTSLSHLPEGPTVAEPLTRALEASDWQGRLDDLAAALRALNEMQRGTGLPTADDPLEPFHDRAGLGIRADVIELLESSISGTAVAALPRGVGSAEQWSHNVDVLVDPRRRRTA